MYVIELWFAIYSGWSGQIIYERWTIGLYNVFFTALPPFAIGIFDKVCSAETMLKYPALYKPSQSAQLFNVRVFWVWIGNALVHSVILFWAPMLAYGNETIWGNGKSGDYLVLGNIVYTVSESNHISTQNSHQTATGTSPPEWCGMFIFTSCTGTGTR